VTPAKALAGVRYSGLLSPPALHMMLGKRYCFVYFYTCSNGKHFIINGHWIGHCLFACRPQPIWTQASRPQTPAAAPLRVAAAAANGCLIKQKLYTRSYTSARTGSCAHHQSMAAILVLCALSPQGVIPAKPDAWVWLGDFAYFDDPLINCDLVPSYPECNCTADFIRRPPFQCFAGVAEHARLRVQLQVQTRVRQPGSACAQPDSAVRQSHGGKYVAVCAEQMTISQTTSSAHAAGLLGLRHLGCCSVAEGALCPTSAACLQLGIREYQQFLSFMCPGYQKTGVFPPLGTDPAMCPRPIFGTYDDHDSGWNNGNAR
jgi:hypothetical protein